jgi:hypothetical protein
MEIRLRYCTCSDDVVCLDLVSICDTFKDVEEEEGDAVRPTGSETMEEPKNLKSGKRIVSDVTDSIGDCLPYTNDNNDMYIDMHLSSIIICITVLS